MASLNLDEKEAPEWDGGRKSELEASGSYSLSILYVLTILVSLGVVVWFFIRGDNQAFRPINAGSNFPDISWIFARAVRELVVTGILLWLATRSNRSNIAAHLSLIACVFGLIVVQYWEFFSNAFFISSWINGLTFALCDLCNWYWMYVGIACASAWFKFALIPRSYVSNGFIDTREIQEKLRRKARVAIRIGLAYSACLLLLAVGLFAIYGYSSSDFILWLWIVFCILIAPLTLRWLLGLSFIGWLFTLNGPRNRRVLGIGILALGCLSVWCLALVAMYPLAHFSFLRAIYVQNSSVVILFALLTLLPSPLLGYLLAIFMTRIFGFRFVFINGASKMLDKNRYLGAFDDFSDAEDPEMYL
ncbi:hypothetical protein SH449x_003615 [Pirellulaceae bacterium SH449]